MVSRRVRGRMPWLLKWCGEERHVYLNGTGKGALVIKRVQGRAPWLLRWYGEGRHGY